MDAGAEPITNPDELRRVRTQARAVHFKAGLTAIILTAIIVLVA